MRSDLRALSTLESAKSGQLPVSQEGSKATCEKSVDTDNLDLEGGSQDTASPVLDAREEMHHNLKVLGGCAHVTRVTEFPAEGMTTKAVEVYVYSIGSLLYLWNQTEVSSHVRSLYHPQRDLKPVYATRVFAMSAAGS